MRATPRRKDEAGSETADEASLKTKVTRRAGTEVDILGHRDGEREKKYEGTYFRFAAAGAQNGRASNNVHGCVLYVAYRLSW